jgi:Predicted integral membrane protein (DUF2269)
MYRIFKFFHLLGLTLFLGSIFGHIAVSVLGGGPDSPNFLFARQDVAAATQALTMPGLGLAILSGIGMAVIARLSPSKTRWLAVHGGLALVVAIIAITAILPAIRQILHDAIALRDGLPEASTAQILASKRIEDTAGGINVLLALTVAAIGVWKPKL